MVNIKSKLIPNGAITQTKIADLAIISQKIANLAVVENKIANGAITESKIATNAVTNAKLANNSVDSDNIVNGAIDGVHFSVDGLGAPLRSKRTCLQTKVENITLGTSTNLDVTDDFFQAAKVAGGVRGMRQNGDDLNPGIVTQLSLGNVVGLETFPQGEPLINTNNDVIFGRVVVNNTAVPNGVALLNNGSNIITGTGTLFLSDTNVGQYIKPLGSNYVGKIQSVDSDLQITLEDNWEGANIASDSLQIAGLLLEFKSINGGGSEVSETMQNEVAQAFFPQSFDFYEAPFTAFSHNVAFGGGAGGAHDHDDLYYLKTELGDNAPLDGARLIGYDPTANPHSIATNVADALDDVANAVGTGGGSSATFVQEVRTVTATNTIDPLSQIPTSANGVMLFLSGQLRRNGAGHDFVVSGQNITWVSPVQLVPGNVIIAFYPVTISVGGFIQESRAILGLNTLQPLSQIPSNPASVQCYLSGQLRNNGVDFTISGQNINWISPDVDVNPGDTIIFSYLHT